MDVGEYSGAVTGRADDVAGMPQGERGGGPGERIAVGAGDDGVARLQLAARWAEAFAPHQGDSLAAALRRFRLAYEFLDAVTHGVEPPSLEEGQTASATR